MSEFGTIADIPAEVPLSDKVVIDAMYEVEEKRKKKQKEYDSGRDPREVYNYAVFRCLGCKAEILRADAGAMQRHHDTCDYHLKYKQASDFSKSQRLAGSQELNYQLHLIERAKYNIESLQRQIHKAQTEKHRLLNSIDSDKAEGARLAHDEYLKMTQVQRQRRYI